MVESDTNPEAKEVPSEVERKFLVNLDMIDLDALGIADAMDLEQYYLSIEDDGSETRVRKTKSLLDNGAAGYEKTTKSDGTLSRGEVNTTITEEEFNALVAAGYVGQKIHKHRVTIPYNDHVIELDIYRDELVGLVVAEVEFHAADAQSAVSAAHEFTTPDWFGVEVTSDKRYKNKNLALHGLPAIT